MPAKTEPNDVLTESPWSKHERPSRLWLHPVLVDFITSHADAIADELAAYRSAVAALAGVKVKRDELTARVDTLRNELIAATPERSERLIRELMPARVELEVMPQRMAAAEQRHAETRAAFLGAIDRIARREAIDLNNGGEDHRRALGEVNRRLQEAESNTYAEWDEPRAALRAERASLAPRVNEINRQAQALWHIANMAKNQMEQTR